MLTTLATLLLSTTTVTVTIPAQAKVQGSEMELADIAIVTGEDEKTVELIREFDLGYAPAPGYHRTLRQWKLEEDLERAFPDVEVKFTGETVMRIFPATATITAGEIEVAARKAITDIFDGSEIRISLRGKLNDLEVPLGEVARKLEVDIAGRRRSAGSWSIPVRVLIDGEQYSTTWVPMQVEVFRQLPVLKHDVRLGVELTKADYTIERVLIGTGMQQMPLEGGPGIGALAARNLTAGSVLYQKDVKYALFVEKNATAKLEARNGSIQIDVMVIVLEDGHLGDRVRVRSLSGDKEVTARVVGRNRLEFNLATDGPITKRNVTR